jgi:hypothetical protein
MAKQAQARKRYPSDLADDQWAIAAPLIPPAKSGPRGKARHGFLYIFAE